MQLHCEPVPDMACWVRQATRAADTAQLRHVSCKLSSLYPRGRLAVPDFYKTGTSQLRRFGSGGGGVYAAAAATATASPSASPASGWTPSRVPRVCILGGGFGGLYAAVRLESLLWPRDTKPEITLVDRTERFVFKPLLYELIQGTATSDEVAPRFDQLLAPYATNFVQGSVDSIEPLRNTETGSHGGGRVKLNNGASVDYDWLVLALGSETNTFGVPGAREHAITFCSYSDVEKIIARIQRIEALPGPSPVAVVVGAGYAGVELAATVAERLPSATVQIVSSGEGILPACPPGQREAANAILQRYGVQVVQHAKVSKIELEGTPASTSADTARRRVTVEYKDKTKQDLPADLVLWTAGSAPSTQTSQNPLKLPFPADKRGSTQTDATLRVQGHSNVFALGDVATPSMAEPLPNTAQVAFQQADYVAWNVWSSINHRPLLPFKYQHLGEAMSLGKINAAITAPFEVPTEVSQVLQNGAIKPFIDAVGIRLAGSGSSKGLTIEGPLAGVLRRGAYWYRQPTLEQRIGVGQAWLQRFVNDATSAAAGAFASSGGSARN